MSQLDPSDDGNRNVEFSMQPLKDDSARTRRALRPITVDHSLIAQATAPSSPSLLSKPRRSSSVSGKSRPVAGGETEEFNLAHISQQSEMQPSPPPMPPTSLAPKYSYTSESNAELSMKADESSLRGKLSIGGGRRSIMQILRTGSFTKLNKDEKESNESLAVAAPPKTDRAAKRSSFGLFKRSPSISIPTVISGPTFVSSTHNLPQELSTPEPIITHAPPPIPQNVAAAVLIDVPLSPVVRVASKTSLPLPPPPPPNYYKEQNTGVTVHVEPISQGKTKAKDLVRKVDQLEEELHSLKHVVEELVKSNLALQKSVDSSRFVESTMDRNLVSGSEEKDEQDTSSY